jgi:hypothetical protein
MKKLRSFLKTLPGAVAAVAIVLAAVSIGARAPSAGAADGPALSGYAWSDNIGWITFQDIAQPVRIDAATGALTGFAWSDNIGWVKFGGLSGFPNSSLGGNAVLEDGLRLKGWARACAGTQTGDCSSMVSRTDGWDGWISLAGPGLVSGRYGVTLSDREFEGFAWGSDVVGWVNWSGVFADSDVGSCFGPNGELILNGQSRTYYSAVKADGTCDSVVRTCTDGTLAPPSAYTSLTCGAPAAECERAGVRLLEGEQKVFYTERLVSGGNPACAGFSDLVECCEGLGENLTCSDGVLVGEDGLPDTDHDEVRCSPAPQATEF